MGPDCTELTVGGISLIEFEKRVFRYIIFGSLFFGGFCIAMGAATLSAGWMQIAAGFFFFSVLFALFWGAQACFDSMRDFGLGEGMANLYGEERAKMMFSEVYKRPDAKDD